MLYPLGILKYHHFPTNDFDKFIKSFDDTIKLFNISNHWRVSICHQIVQNAWDKIIFNTASEILNYFEISGKLETQLFLKGKQINLREITPQLLRDHNLIHGNSCKYINYNYQIIPITETQYNQLPSESFFFGYTRHNREPKIFI